MNLPQPGTPQFDAFMRKARNPHSVEAKIIQQMNQNAADEMQSQVRHLLYGMIEHVHGQLFRDVSRFHSKFELAPTTHPNHELPADFLKFRFNFMVEELQEYATAVGLKFQVDSENLSDDTGTFDAEKAFDALIDLVYVALGTAFMHRFPFNQGWDRVQEANMAKVRAEHADDPRSHRKHSADIVKPEGWKPPVLTDLLGPIGVPCECSIPGGPHKKLINHGADTYCEVCSGKVVARDGKKADTSGKSDPLPAVTRQEEP